MRRGRKFVKLYDVPRNSFVRVIGDRSKTVLLFHHIDGMYSLCEDRTGRVCHIPAWANVKIVTGFDSSE